MKIIDAHLHLCRKPGFDREAKSLGGENSMAYVEQEFRRNHIVLGIGMGNQAMEQAPNAPLMLDLAGPMTWAPYNYPDFIACCLGISASDISKENQAATIEKFAEVLPCDRFVGIKIYAGYEPYALLDWRYLPFYDLAASFDVPVVIHTGETANHHGLLKYAHPLLVDELAMQFPKTRFVIAHYGSPWLEDAAEVVSKNKNVAIDLSGLLSGNFDADSVWQEQSGYFQLLRTWNEYMKIYDRLLYGSDWPLVSMAAYIEIMARLIPGRYQEDVFYHNAREVFPRIRSYT